MIEKSLSYWKREYIHRHESAHRTSWTACYTRFNMEKNIRLFFNHAIEKSKKEKHPVKVLDLGCEIGLNIFMLNNFFKNDEIKFTGIDLSPHFIEMANMWKWYRNIQNAEFMNGNAEALAINNSVFDIIICTEVLEHLPHPENAVREIHRVLKKDGRAIISAPTKDRNLIIAWSSKLFNLLTFGVIKRRVNREQKRAGELYDDMRALHPEVGWGHISLKTAKEWKTLFENQGLKLEKIHGSAGLVYGGPSSMSDRQYLPSYCS